MTRTIPKYPFDTRHPDATAGILPLETRQMLLDEGWIHESEVDAASNTRHTGRRRWSIPHAMFGNERYFRIEDVLDRLNSSYQEHRQSLADRAVDVRKIDTALA